jgi:hypothetical protein
MKMSAIMDEPKAKICPPKWTIVGDVQIDEGFTLSNNEAGQSEITFDYGRAEGGMPFIQTKAVSSAAGPVEVDIIFSETFEGLLKENGVYSITWIDSS